MAGNSLKQFLIDTGKFIFLILLGMPFLYIVYIFLWVVYKVIAFIYEDEKYTLASGTENMLGWELFKTKFSYNIMNVQLFTKDVIKEEELRDLFMKRVILARDQNNQLQFSKLTYRINLRAGYQMWCKHENFNIDEHVVTYDGKYPKDEDDLKSIINHICNIPLSTSKPPWQMIIIPFDDSLQFSNNIRTKCLLLVRCHHVMADGISVFRIAIEELAQNRTAFLYLAEKFKRPKPVHQYIENILAMSWLPVITWRAMVCRDNNIIRGPKLSGKKIYDWSQPIQLSTLKHIKNVTSTTLNDVVMSCTAGGLRKFLQQHGAPPDFLQCCIPANLQYLDEPIKVENQYSYLVVKMPTGPMNPIQRLHAQKAIMDKRKRSLDVIVNKWVIQQFCTPIPHRFANFINYTSPCSITFSNIPGPADKSGFDDNTIERLFGFNNLVAKTGIAIMALTYSDSMTISIVVDEAIVKEKSEVKMILQYITDEIQQLNDDVANKQH
ncbi:hypothetical protein CHUAL_013519 [Chamberlinius hualienensis]